MKENILLQHESYLDILETETWSIDIVYGCLQLKPGDTIIQQLTLISNVLLSLNQEEEK